MDVAVGISPVSQIDDLEDKVNQFLAEARADGTLDDMYDRWVSRAEGAMPEIPAPVLPENVLCSASGRYCSAMYMPAPPSGTPTV